MDNCLEVVLFFFRKEQTKMGAHNRSESIVVNILELHLSIRITLTNFFTYLV